ncbi:STAS domain-containing protein [Streptomyces sp. NBC_01451]|uniref:STAS domain-containing protein n=1 Tax=Streptomyces sp. NBC_01451 TaxID=2903872 RepID=UPI002E308DF0|nr:STAS domain-containing protein [Streptomyces sp. NBC_01451]
MDLQDTNAASGQGDDDSAPGEAPVPCRYARSYLDHGVTVVEFHGTIDLNTVCEVQVHTDAATARQGARMIVDLRPVEFLDCTALGLLCRARRRALEHGGHLALVCARPWHLRILKAAGLSELFLPLATVQDALSALNSEPANRP